MGTNLQQDHPFERSLRRKFRTPLTRTCGLPSCTAILSVDLFERESDFLGKKYCESHQEIANRRRKKLRAALASIEILLEDDDVLAAANDGQEQPLTRAQLRKWKRRLAWQLDSLPHA